MDGMQIACHAVGAMVVYAKNDQRFHFRLLTIFFRIRLLIN
jgi:hypothetical protein